MSHRRGGLDSWVGRIPWRRKWQPAPVFLPGESYGQRSLVGYSLDCKELDMTARTLQVNCKVHWEKRNRTCSWDVSVPRDPSCSFGELLNLSELLFPLPMASAFLSGDLVLPATFLCFLENLKPTQQIGKSGGTTLFISYTPVQSVFGVNKKEKSGGGFQGRPWHYFLNYSFSNYFLIEINFHQKL